MSPPSSAPAAVPCPPQGAAVCTNFWHCFTTAMINFGNGFSDMVTGQMTASQFGQQFVNQQQWVYLLILFIATLAVVFFIAMVALAARRCPTCPTAPP